MKTSTDIAMMIREVLIGEVEDIPIVWERAVGLESQIVIQERTSYGDSNLRRCAVVVNVHVQDIFIAGENRYETHKKRLNDISKRVSNVLRRLFFKGTGANISIGSISQPMKEQDANEHFVSISIISYIRESL